MSDDPPWFYVTPERQQAEAPGGLAPLVSQGIVRRETLVWKEGLPDWRPAGEVAPELFPSTSNTLAAPATPSMSAPPTLEQALPPSGLAVASLVLGIVSLVLCGSILTAVPGVVCGHLALGQIRQEPERYGGRSLAITGLVLGYVVIALTVIIAAIYILFFLGIIGAAAVGGAPA